MQPPPRVWGRGDWYNSLMREMNDISYKTGEEQKDKHKKKKADNELNYDKKIINKKKSIQYSFSDSVTCKYTLPRPHRGDGKRGQFVSDPTSNH